MSGIYEQRIYRAQTRENSLVGCIFHMIPLCNLSILESRSIRAWVIKMFRYSHCCSLPLHTTSCQNQGYERSSLDELLEGAVDGRADFGALVEIDCGYGTLTDAFGGKFEFLIL